MTESTTPTIEAADPSDKDVFDKVTVPASVIYKVLEMLETTRRVQLVDKATVTKGE